MNTHRIGSLTVTVSRVDDKGAMLYFAGDRDEYRSRVEPVAPLRSHDMLLVPLPLWQGIQKLLALREDVEKLQALLLSKEGWPASTGDERTDLIAQRSAISSRLAEATNATLAALTKLAR